MMTYSATHQYVNADVNNDAINRGADTSDECTTATFTQNKAANHAVTTRRIPLNKVRTPGWKLFDFLVYGLMQYVINIALSLAMWWDSEFNGKAEHLQAQKAKIQNMDSGIAKTWQKMLYGYRRGFNIVNEWTIKNISNPAAKFVANRLPEKSLIDIKNGRGESIIKTPNKAEKAAIESNVSNIITGYLLLAWGGRILMLPNKILEDRKPQIVRFFDKTIDAVKAMFGKKPSAQELEERKEIYKKLDSELSTESWGKLWKARFTGEAMVGAAILTPLLFDPQRKGITRVGDIAMHGLRKLETVLGKNWPFLHPAPQGSYDALYPPKANKLAGLAWAASIEGMATGIVATSLYLKLKAKELFGKNAKNNDPAPSAKQNPDIKNCHPPPNARQSNQTVKDKKQDAQIQPKHSWADRNKPSNHKYSTAQSRKETGYAANVTSEHEQQIIATL